MESIDVVIESHFKGAGANQATQAINKVKNAVNSLSKTSITDVLNNSLLKRGDFDMSKKFQFDVAGAEAKQMAKDISTGLKNAEKDAKRFKMEYLSIMFFGMAIQRLFGGILKSSYQTWSAVTEGTNMAGGAMGELAAATSFFKFQLFEALQQSGLFQTIVDVVLRLVDWFSNLSDSTKRFYANVVLVAAAIGTLLFGLGTITLGLQGVNTVLAEATGLKLSLGKLLGVFFIGLAIKEGADAWKNIKDGKWASGMLDALESALFTVAGLKMVTGGKGGTYLLLGLALEFVQTDMFSNYLDVFAAYVVAFFRTMWEKIGHDFNNTLSNAAAATLINIGKMLKNTYFFRAIGSQMMAAGESLRQSNQFDWTGAFDRNYAESMNAARNTPNLIGYLDNLGQSLAAKGDPASPGTVNIGNVDALGYAVAQNLRQPTEKTLSIIYPKNIMPDGYEYYE